MPWNAHTAMSLRRELVLLADQPGANLAEIARRFGVSRKTAYERLDRYRTGGASGRRGHGHVSRRAYSPVGSDCIDDATHRTARCANWVECSSPSL